MRAMLTNRCLAAFVAAAIVLASAFVGGCAPGAPQADAPAAGAAAESTSQVLQGGEPLHTSTVKVVGDERAVITTAKGVIEISFSPTEAPNTVASFIELAESGFFDGVKFHRVEPGLLIQGGDPLSKTDDPATGMGGPPWRLKAEFSSLPHVEGTVAMARRADDVDSAGSQFYIGLTPLPSLDNQYTVFGTVTKGLDVARAIAVGDVMTSVKIVHGQ
jgi:cyclophilin family peptidyl-prolyl cis-trans isomerase